MRIHSVAHRPCRCKHQGFAGARIPANDSRAEWWLVVRRTEPEGRSLVERLRGRPGLLSPRAIPRADNALLGMEQRRRRRRWAVLAIAVVAFADVVGAVVPRTRHHLAILERNFPLGLSEGGRALLLVAGLLLLLLARGLARGYRRAWIGALLLTIASAVLHLAGNLDPIAAGLALVPPVYLWTIRDTFVARARPLTLALVLASCRGSSAACSSTGSSVGRSSRSNFPTATSRTRIDTIVRSAFFLTTAPDGDTALARAFVRSLQLFGAASLLVARDAAAPAGRRAVGAPLRHCAPARASSTGGVAPAWPRSRDCRRTRRSSSPTARCCSGTARSPASRSVSAIRSASRAPSSRRSPTSSRRCERNGWTPVLLAASHATAEHARRFGFESVAIGEEAVVDLQGFTTAGKERAKLRQNTHRAERDDVVVVQYTRRAPHVDGRRAAPRDQRRVAQAQARSRARIHARAPRSRRTSTSARRGSRSSAAASSRSPPGCPISTARR